MPYLGLHYQANWTRPLRSGCLALPTTRTGKAFMTGQEIAHLAHQVAEPVPAERSEGIALRFRANDQTCQECSVKLRRDRTSHRVNHVGPVDHDMNILRVSRRGLNPVNVYWTL
jgi:hypothetical protein